MFTTAALASPPGQNDAIIYVSPSPANTDAGTSELEQTSLQAAIELSQKKFAAGYRTVTIRVRPGRYLGQQNKTAGAGKGRRLIITTAQRHGDAVFDGEGQLSTWLAITGRKAEPANLIVSGLIVTGYMTAITMNGSRDDLDNVVSNVQIRSNVFDAIGQVDARRSEPSTAVIRLVNGDNNQIVGNVFTHFRNREKCSLLHAVYVAHNSTGNLIKDNRFEDGCGDAIRFRDASGNNLVHGNRFVDAWVTAPITDWYCDAASRSDCTKRDGECPSLNNRLVDNEMVANRAPQNGMSAEFGATVTELCAAPADAKRFIVP
jgi:hypothetical protein